MTFQLLQPMLSNINGFSLYHVSLLRRHESCLVFHTVRSNWILGIRIIYYFLFLSATKNRVLKGK